ncbi:hypothetical protein Cgig2_009220 [Carnegiea gigantea]|uniref:Uncharacterized protein n=1 Tax=Carnegiea gigantea TaxID=171969 RepID=A0A9Q1GH65_9CARY|nr:hypothetical protein Cgig2_009220 [Carnegiea gigantea]
MTFTHNRQKPDQTFYISKPCYNRTLSILSSSKKKLRVENPMSQSTILPFPSLSNKAKLNRLVLVINAQECSWQGKALTSIFHIQDQHDQRAEGFEDVTRVMTKYYQELLGRKNPHRTRVDPLIDGFEAFIMSLRKLKISRKFRGLIHALVNAAIYNIWQVRNRKLFNSLSSPAQEIWKDIKKQITLRVLQLHQSS